MKSLTSNLFNLILIFFVIVAIVLIIVPFRLVNLEQAQRIANWINVYEKAEYSFSLVNEYEGDIIPTPEETGHVISDEYIMDRLTPYFNLDENSKTEEGIKNYSYRLMNGKAINKNSQFYFDKFIRTKDGVLLSLRQNLKDNAEDNLPLFFMFVDINGVEKPNRVGQDIFIINVYKNEIKPLGYGKKHAQLKLNCSPLGNGLYCAEHYLKGGMF